MVPAASFVIGFVLIGLAVVLVAMRGGPRGAREALHTQGARGRTATTLAIAAVSAAFGIAIPAAVLAEGGDDDKKARGGVELSASQAEGRRLFTYNCGTCHTLKAANTAGRVGPNLDEMRPPKALTLDAIDKGRARGQGQMPGGLVVGEEAEQVASFIEAVAGR
jgi:mono/diheme cytochrome c family protein